jgi:hypothetical protein
MRDLLAVLVFICFSGGCERNPTVSKAEAAQSNPAAEIQRAEQKSAERRAEVECRGGKELYSGSITVDSEYVHPVKRGEKYVDEPVPGLDRVVSKAPQLRFTLDYPFEKPFNGVVTGELTLRRIIDSVRAGYRTMYQGTQEREIPGLMNKDVRGPYGRAFHVIGDLVIEGIQLCDDNRLDLTIGS